MSSSIIKIFSFSLCLIFSLGSTTSFAKEYYKWVDAKGSTHYTAMPPPKSAQKKGKVDTYGWNNSNPRPTTTQQPNLTTEQSTTDAEKAAQENRPVVDLPPTVQKTVPAADAEHSQNASSNN